MFKSECVLKLELCVFPLSEGEQVTAETVDDGSEKTPEVTTVPPPEREVSTSSVAKAAAGETFIGLQSKHRNGSLRWYYTCAAPVMGFCFVRYVGNVNIGIFFQAMSPATIQHPVQMGPRAVKPKKATGLAVLYPRFIIQTLLSCRRCCQSLNVFSVFLIIPRLFVVKISFTAAHTVRNVIWLPWPAMTTRAPCRGSPRYPQSPGRSHRWGKLRVIPPSVVLMPPPAARTKQAAGPAVLYRR